MKYTRKFFNQFEWFHTPISPIEESFILPLQINGSISVLSKRLGPAIPKNCWRIIHGYLYFSDEYWRLIFQPSFLLLPLQIIRELRVARDRWLTEILPSYQLQIDKIAKAKLNSFSSLELVNLLNCTAELEGWFFSEALYVGVICGMSELLLKFTYPLLIHTPSTNHNQYRELLVGFPDKGLESDAAFWKVAQVRDKNAREKQLLEWIEQFGYRIQDKDLLYPTLGENRRLIDSYITLYQDLPDPRLRQQRAVARRRQCQEDAFAHVRFSLIMKPVFSSLVSLVQRYAQIRNSRPFYYQGNKYMRQILRELSQRIHVREFNDVFFLKMTELEQIAGGETSILDLDALIKERKKLYEKRLEGEPVFEVSI